MENYSSRKNLIQVSKLYYVAGMSQEEIAEIMNISRSKVSRMLSLAKEMKVVQFQISEYPTLQSELEVKIAGHFGLSPVIVVPSESSIEQTKTSVGSAAAKLLSYYLEDNLNIGVVWGSTIDKMVEAFQREGDFQNVQCIQLCGGMHISNTIADGRETVRKLAQKIGAKSVLLQYPMLVRDTRLVDLMHESECKEYYELLNHIDVAFISTGSDIAEESATYQGGYITLEESQRLIDSGCAADICGIRLTEDGKEANTMLSGHVVGVALENLHKTPTVIAVGAGKNKTKSLMAAAKGKHITGMILDEVSAISIVQQENIE